MSQDSLEQEISREEAIEALTNETEGLERVSEDHELPKIYMEAWKFDEGLIWDERDTFSNRERDEAISLVYELVDSWADERGYDVVIEAKDYFSKPIDEDLFYAVDGYIDMEGYEIDFNWHSWHNSISFRFADDNRMDASMTEEYRELYSLAESVLGDVGTIENRKPDL